MLEEVALSAPVDVIVRIVDLAGVLANAMLGGLAARTARLDIFGFVVLAIASGLGGGIIRDVLLGSGPVLALTNPFYLWVAIAGALVVAVVPFRSPRSAFVLVVVDASALGCWAAVGTQRGLSAGLGWLPAILLGVVTAVGGGMVRDLLLVRRPAVLGGNTLYATSALVATVVVVAFSALDLPIVGTIVALVIGATLSLLARHYKWTLPLAPLLTVPGLRGNKSPRTATFQVRTTSIPIIKRQEDGAQTDLQQDGPEEPPAR